MTIETALPPADTSAEASASATAEQLDTSTPEMVEQDKPAESEKPQKTAEERELDRARRKIDRLVRQREELRAQVRMPLAASTQSQAQHTNEPASDDEPLTLSRAELDRMVTERAQKLAPTIKQQEAEIEQRRGVVAGLQKEWGQEKFDAIARDLDEAFDGLTDDKGRPKPAADAIFESDAPKALIEYLADPENADEAEALGRMSAIAAGRAVAKLEAKLAAKKAEAKPQPSKAAAPIEAVKGGGTVNSMPDPSDTKAYIKWANEQERRR